MHDSNYTEFIWQTFYKPCVSCRPPTLLTTSHNSLETTNEMMGSFSHNHTTFFSCNLTELRLILRWRLSYKLWYFYYFNVWPGIFLHLHSSVLSLIQSWEKPRRLWRMPAWGWRSSRTELGNWASTWAWSGPASPAPSATPAVTTRSRTPPRHSCATTSDSRCLSCRSAQTLHACVTSTPHIWLQRCRHGCKLKLQFLE